MLITATNVPVYSMARWTGTGLVATTRCGSIDSRTSARIDVNPYPNADESAPAGKRDGIGKTRASSRDDADGRVLPSSKVGWKAFVGTPSLQVEAAAGGASPPPSLARATTPPLPATVLATFHML